MAYFDHNATTPLSPGAREAWLQAADNSWQNPSSLYRSAARVRNLLESARASLSASLVTSPDRLLFNSGATEGANALFQHFAAAHPDQPVLLSALEHPCGLAAAERFFAGRLRFIQPGRGGRIDPAAIEAEIEHNRPALVSVMAVNNETGVLQPWQEIARLCRRHAIPFHCDASQWLGKLPAADFGSCDFLTAAAHKFGGPKGIGMMLVPSGSDFRGQTGGEQERGLRGGTEDYPAIAALAAAFQAANDHAGNRDLVTERLQWRQEFEQEILQKIPGTRIAGRDEERLWNTVSLIFPEGANDRWVRKLDRLGFEVSTGSACTSGEEAPSHVLSAMGYSAAESHRAIRVSGGWETTREEWRHLAGAIGDVYQQIRQSDQEDGGLTQVIRI
jgi:cysteine desulfurase